VLYLGASSKELLFNNQGSGGNDASLGKIFNDDNMVDTLAATHPFKGLLEGLFRDLTDDGQTGEAVIEALGVVCGLKGADPVSLWELGLDGGGDQGGGEECWWLWAHCCALFVCESVCGERVCV